MGVHEPEGTVDILLDDITTAARHRLEHFLLGIRQAVFHHLPVEMLAIPPEHLDGIAFAMKLGQKHCRVPMLIQQSLQSTFLFLEISLIVQDSYKAAVDVCLVALRIAFGTSALAGNDALFSENPLGPFGLHLIAIVKHHLLQCTPKGNVWDIIDQRRRCPCRTRASFCWLQSFCSYRMHHELLPISSCALTISQRQTLLQRQIRRPSREFR